jgi:RHS repeat-associated protein
VTVTSGATLETNGFNCPFSTALEYDNQAGGVSWGLGKNWQPLHGLGGLTFDAGIVKYNGGANSKKAFLPLGGGLYQQTYFILDRLYFDAASNKYKITTPDGSVKFFDVTGNIISFQNPGGIVGSTTYTGGKLTAIVATDGTDSWEFDYLWVGIFVQNVTFKVNGNNVRKADYVYDSDGNLLTIKTYAYIGGSWGTQSVEAVRYSYGTDGLLRHIITSTGYRQMVNNGINPDTASEAQLNDYAETEYTYDVTTKRVTRMYSHGRLYIYDFTYTSHIPKGIITFNDWTMKTEIAYTAAGKSESSLVRYYFNSGGAVILQQIDNDAVSATKTWNVEYHQYDDNCNGILLADAAAIDTVDEATSTLVTLKTDQGRVSISVYYSNGRLYYTGVRQGSSGALNKLSEMTYIAQAVTGLGTIYLAATETVYRENGSTGSATTSYAYNFHSGTFQISQRVTTLPTIPTGENGTGIAVVLTENYDVFGLLTSSVDGRGSVTNCAYSPVVSAMTYKVVDYGLGLLNLRTDYLVDDLGRTILELGPTHDVALGGASTSIRQAQWTYYKDREGEIWTFAGYRRTTGSVDQIVGPVTIIQLNQAPPSGYAGYRQSSRIDALFSSAGIPATSTTFAQSSWVRLTIELFSKADEKREEWKYFLIPSTGYGSQSTNYGKKLFAYDWMRRSNEITCAGGTIDKTTYNAIGWPIQEELGTSAGLVITRTNAYDISGNLTQVALPVDGSSTNDRVTDNTFDYRHRLILQATTVEKDGGGTWTLFTAYGYDNRGLQTSITNYHTSVGSGNRTRYSLQAFDALGRRYRVERTAVDAAGNLGNTLTDNWYYDETGMVARKVLAGSSLAAVAQFDAAGRQIAGLQATGTFSVTAPSDIANATVIEQVNWGWDAAGNCISAISKLRFDAATGTGPLNDSTHEPKARASYVAFYPNAIGRTQANADYGTNGSSTWTRVATIPLRSDLVLVTSNAYDTAGNLNAVTNPSGIKTCYTYDQSDRLTVLVENCQSSSSSSSGSSGFATDVRTTRYEYTDDSWLKKLKCDNTATGQQTTEWVYGVAIGQGSALYSNRLVYKKIYPDSTGSSDLVTYTYNRQRQVITSLDQAGTAHSYAFDKLGRVYRDVAAAGTGVENSVNKLDVGFNERGLIVRAASYLTTGGAKRNEIGWEYNSFDQPVTEYQEHSGQVNASTSLKVQYMYENGSSNTIRPTGITYPNGNAISTEYLSSLSNALSRPDAIKESGSTLASMRYLGLRVPIDLLYDAAANAELTYQNGGTGDAGDIYTGIDRFGRLIETIWKTSSAELLHTKYGRNRVGGVTWKRDVLAHASSVTTEDHFHWYDGLQQNYQHERGDLTPSGGPPYTGIASATRQQQEIRGFDETGNWLTNYVANPSLAQSRTHNKANEIASLSGPSGVTTPSYDLAGNMTVMPAPGAWSTAYTLKWDAWSRLVEIKQGITVISSHIYDAFSRRVSKTDATETRNYYYGKLWRCVEERVGGGVKSQYTWSPVDRWTLIRRTRSVSGTLDEGRFVLNDYLDPSAIITSAGAVDERYSYDDFGSCRILTSAFASRTTSSCAWNFLFHAEFIDQESRLYNCGYRLYHNDLGRWISRDPIRENGGLNLYGYVGDNSVNRTDFLGLVPPVYNPGNWNDPGHNAANNCYTYACDTRKPPGTTKDHQQPGSDAGAPTTGTDCQSVKSAAHKDGLKDKKGKCCPKGYHEVELYSGEHVHEPGVPLDASGVPVDPNDDIGADYHWYRQDSNGQWSSKHGNTPVGPQVSNPQQDADDWGYHTPCGKMCAKD